ncbi:hypothetical protein VCV18_012034 [Metarhizium anisopliae]
MATSDTKVIFSPKLYSMSNFGFTLIVNKLTLPLDLSQSYLTFYNKGEVSGVVTLEAAARVSYGKKKVIADIPFPGASSKIPGIATIGPQLVVKGGINARLSMAGTVETKLQIAKWNVRQVVPDNSQYKPELIDNSHTDLDRTGYFEGIKKPEFYAGVKVSGDVEVKLSAAAEFGIRFVERWKVEPAGAAIVGEATVTAGPTAGISTTGTCPFTYELDVGAHLFARVTAPDPFGIGWSGAEVTITEGKKNIFKEGTCPGLGPVPTRRALGIIEGGNTDDNDSALSTAYGGHLLPALWDSSALTSTDKVHLSSLSKRGGVYGPALSIPVGNVFCPPPTNSKDTEDGPMSCAASSGSDDNASRRKRSKSLEQHLHGHVSADRRRHVSSYSEGHQHHRTNDTDTGVLTAV